MTTALHWILVMMWSDDDACCRAVSGDEGDEGR